MDPNRPTTRRVNRSGIWSQLIELPAIRLEVRSGPDRGRSTVLALSTIHLGSGPDNDLVVRDPAVSRVHARLSIVDAGLRLEDLESTNGTYVNGVRSRDVVFEKEARFVVGETEVTARPARERFAAFEEPRDRLGPLIGASEPMRRLYATIEAAAPTPVTIMVTGESGTGKELAAQAIHQLSGRQGRLVTFDCAGTSPDLIRSELFGHRKGAFTGADVARDGAFRRAHGGTLFLDELGELPGPLQPLLLRALETRTVQPLGSDDVIPVDVRLVVATHRDLEQMVRAGQFRLDLLNRLHVVKIEMPPLRERLEDLPSLAASLGAGLAFSPQAMARLASHRWPGNVRELRNLLDRLTALCRGRTVEPADLRLGDAPAVESAAGELRRTVHATEREALLAALERTGWNKTQAAKVLGIGLSSLKRKLAEHGITRDAAGGE